MPPKSIKVGYEINPATGRQRKSCRQDQVRDPQTGRCKKVRPKRSSPKKKKSPRRKSIKVGYEINPLTGIQRKSCRQDQVRDPRTGRCKKIAPKKSSPKKKKSSRKIQMEECPVCFEDTPNLTLPCNHPLCTSCIKQIKRQARINNPPCPLCRRRIIKLVNKKSHKKSHKKSPKKSPKKSDSNFDYDDITY